MTNKLEKQFFDTFGIEPKIISNDEYAHYLRRSNDEFY